MKLLLLLLREKQISCKPVYCRAVIELHILELWPCVEFNNGVIVKLISSAAFAGTLSRPVLHLVCSVMAVPHTTLKWAHCLA
jgi:hypothetical protein